MNDQATEELCGVPGCKRPEKIHTVCASHYLRCRRHLMPGEVSEKLSAWKHGREKWPIWLTKPFGKPRGLVVSDKPQPEKPAEPKKPVTTAVTSSLPFHGTGGNGNVPKAKVGLSSAGGIAWKTEPVEPLRPSETRVLDPVMRRRVESLRDAADYLSRMTDTTATRDAVRKLLALGTVGCPVPIEDALGELERAAKSDGWVA